MTTDLIPATLVYRDYGLPRAMMRDLVRDGQVRMEVRLSPDGVNQMFLYSRSDIERFLNGGQTNGTDADRY